MCQIFAGPSASVRSLLLDTADLIDDLYAGNPDGMGWMTTDGGVLVQSKHLPKDGAAARLLIESLPQDDRPLALHFRMRTHGAIDLDNAHPYPVTQGVALIHNGVLQHGNKADPTKSDTWHYARSIEAQLQHAPALLHNQAWRDLVERDIGGNNRFVLMDGTGAMYILNRDSGYEKGDVWVANTYSFTAALLWPEMARRTTWPGANGFYYGKWTTEDYIPFGSPPKWESEPSVEDEVYEALAEQDMTYMESLLRDEFDATIDTLSTMVYQGPTNMDDSYDATHRAMIKALEAMDRETLRRYANDADLAYFICCEGNWIDTVAVAGERSER